MERVRARSSLAVGAIALAMAATAAGSAAAPPRDLTADLAPVAARVPSQPRTDPIQDNEEHPGPTPPPSEDPGVDGAPHGNGGMPADDPPGATEDPAHEDDMASDEPVDMGGHMADPSPSAAPGHGHGAEPSAEPSAEPAATDGHGSMPGMDDEVSASHPPASGGHDEAPAGGHDESTGGHGDQEPAAERPRAVVLGGFLALNGIALAGAAVLRRRDRAAGVFKARRIPATQPEKDASR